VGVPLSRKCPGIPRDHWHGMQSIGHLPIDDIRVWSYPAGVVDQLIFTVPSIDSEVIAKGMMPIRVSCREIEFNH
jgi:hypothetical protein